MTYGPLTGKHRTAYHLSTARINIWDGAVRTGKTVGVNYKWCDWNLTLPPGRMMLTGKTERTITKNLITPLQEMIGADRVDLRRGAGEVSIMDRVNDIVGANNELATQKIQGSTLLASGIDEATNLPKSFFEMLVSRHSAKGARIIGTCNPAGPNHWLKTDWLDRAALWVQRDGTVLDRRHLLTELPDDHPDRPLNLHRFSFVIDDNEHLDPAYVREIKGQYKGLFYKRMILGEWAVAEGMVFETFNHDTSIIRPEHLPTMQRVIALGIDYGATNATAGILIGIGADQQLYAIAEWAPPKGMAPSQHAQHLKQWLDQQAAAGWIPEWVYVDPAAKAFRLELFTQKVTNPAAATNTVTDGVMTVCTALAKGMRISSTCTNLLREIPSYTWDPKASAKGEDTPVKRDDHFCDALRYAVHSSQHVWSPYTTL